MGWGAGGSGLTGVPWFCRQMNLALDDAHSLTSHRPVAKPVAMETHPSSRMLTGIDNKASVGEITGRQKAAADETHGNAPMEGYGASAAPATIPSDTVASLRDYRLSAPSSFNREILCEIILGIE